MLYGVIINMCKICKDEILQENDLEVNNYKYT